MKYKHLESGKGRASDELPKLTEAKPRGSAEAQVTIRFRVQEPAEARAPEAANEDEPRGEAELRTL